MAYIDSLDDLFLNPTDRDVPVDLGVAFESEAYSLGVRLAVIVSLSSALWGLVLAGGWGLYRLIA